MAQVSSLGFQIPSTQSIVQHPKEENAILIEKKRRILTELAALENNVSLFDYLDPARDNLLSSVTDVPCSVELLEAPSIERKYVNTIEASNALSDLIMEIASNPTRDPYEKQRPTPICNSIVKHANGFFAQLEASREARSGLLTAFCIIPHKVKDEPTAKTVDAPPPPPQESKPEDDATKRVHPFFPDVVGTKPLQGLMKKQLGEFPNFVKDPPTDEECEENLWMMDKNAIKEHLMKICGSSSDDDFDPDAQLETMMPLTQLPSYSTNQGRPQ